MRFPELDWMQPTFDLMTYLGMPRCDSGITSESGSIIPYIMSADDNISFYNGAALTKEAINASYKRGAFDPFGTSIGLEEDPEGILDKKIGDLKRGLAENWEKGWSALMDLDDWSTRDYMSVTPPKLSQSVGHLCHT